MNSPIFRCKKCQCPKSPGDFYKQKTTKTGFEGVCKDCRKAGMKARYVRAKANPMKKQKQKKNFLNKLITQLFTFFR